MKKLLVTPSVIPVSEPESSSGVASFPSFRRKPESSFWGKEKDPGPRIEPGVTEKK
ncbi:MAG: hypothetical protein K9K79_13725 [Desulfohalobiaceae bacterium]|nr:hypothetical protein [Desulfohalobiaceae bacterium]